MTLDTSSLKDLATTIRVLSAAGVEKAKSGHPGMPMGAADYAAVLWAKYLRFNPKDPAWINRDRFVLSAGHGSMLLYSLLHAFAYQVSSDDLRNFRQWESITPGHPEFGMTPGVETTTGPLGQGISNAVGMALSAKMLGARYDENLFNHRVFGICGDGDLMEGVAAEAASLAGHLKLSNLVFLYDDNNITLAGKTEVCFTEDVAKRFESYGWYVQKIDGHDFAAIDKALENALKEEAKGKDGRPSLICAKTIIGKGSPSKANDYEVHGAPLGAEEFAKTKAGLGWNEADDFELPASVKKYCESVVKNNEEIYNAWNDSFASWEKTNSEKAKALNNQLNRVIPENLFNDLLAVFDDKKDATRNLSNKAIQVMAKNLPWFLGGSADLESSTKTLIKDAAEVQAVNYAGRNIRFGVREHAMGAIANGLSYCECWLPYTATFLVFADYMRPTIRLAALSHLNTMFIFTHDSFWVGEDGPTHQPIEQIASLRIIPNLYVFRPADGLEVAASYYAAATLKNKPSALLFTRQNVNAIARPANFNPNAMLKGAYIVKGFDYTDLVIVATGSEVGTAIEAADMLEAAGIFARVVSMPCMELFLEQDLIYRNEIIPPHAKKVSIEAGVTFGWEKIVGSDGILIGKDSYGASAPGEVLAQKFGLTADAVAKRIEREFKNV